MSGRLLLEESVKSAQSAQAAVQAAMAQTNETKLPRAVLLAFAPLHRLAMGVAVGVVLGGLIFATTTALLLKGGPVIGPNLGLLAEYFFGYSVTWRGAFVGLVWGTGIGFLSGWGFAVLRNFLVWAWLTVIRSRAEMEQYGDFLDHL
jgi:hypothetical protein